MLLNELVSTYSGDVGTSEVGWRRGSGSFCAVQWDDSPCRRVHWRYQPGYRSTHHCSI